MSRQVDRRPLLVALIALIIGLTAPTHPLNLLLLVVLLALARSLRSWALAAAFVTVGAWISPPTLPLLASPRYVEGTLRICSLPQPLAGDRAADGLIDGLNVQVLVGTPPEIHYGDVWYVKGTITPVAEVDQPYFQELGLQGKLTPIRMVLESPGPAWVAGICEWSGAFQRFTEAYIPDADVAGWVQALWFQGGTSRFDDRGSPVTATSAGFTLVAASGLQVYVLAGMAMGLFILLRLPRAWQCGLTILVLASFCIAKGIYPSTFRACVGCSVFLLASSLRREPDGLAALAFAGLVFLLIWPRSLYSDGFQMSFAVVAALCLFPPFRRESRESLGAHLTASAKQFGLACLIMFLAGEPLLAVRTGYVGPGPLPELALFAIVPPVVLSLSMAAFVISGVLPWLANGVMTLAVVPLTAYLKASEDWVSDRLSLVSVPHFSAIWLVLYYGLWLCVWRERAWRAGIRE